jgi:hypothetical protein
MKLLIDGTNILFMSFFIELKREINFTLKDSSEVKSYIIFLFLQRLLYLKKKFDVLAENVIITLDHKISWRKKIFPYYKFHRKIERDKSEIDYQLLYDLIDEFYLELLHFPFITIRNKYMEADDWIGILSHYFTERKENHVIVARDSDFYQLHNQYCKQYNPISNTFINVNNPEFELKMKIINGDKGDKIPNAFSDSDAYFNSEKRQKNLGEKKAAQIIMEHSNLEKYFEANGILNNYLRNEKLIDFRKIPDEIKRKAIEKFEKYDRIVNKMFVSSRFYQRNLKTLDNRIQEIFR